MSNKIIKTEIIQSKSMRFFFFVIILSISSVVWAQQKQVCFSIDDLPVVAYGMNDTSFQKDITNKLFVERA